MKTFNFSKAPLGHAPQSTDVDRALQNLERLLRERSNRLSVAHIGAVHHQAGMPATRAKMMMWTEPHSKLAHV